MRLGRVCRLGRIPAALSAASARSRSMILRCQRYRILRGKTSLIGCSRSMAWDPHRTAKRCTAPDCISRVTIREVRGATYRVLAAASFHSQHLWCRRNFTLLATDGEWTRLPAGQPLLEGSMSGTTHPMGGSGTVSQIDEHRLARRSQAQTGTIRSSLELSIHCRRANRRSLAGSAGRDD